MGQFLVQVVAGLVFLVAIGWLVRDRVRFTRRIIQEAREERRLRRRSRELTAKWRHPLPWNDEE